MAGAQRRAFAGERRRRGFLVVRDASKASISASIISRLSALRVWANSG